MNARDSLAFASQLLVRTLPLSDGLIPTVVLRDYELPLLWKAASLHRLSPCAGPPSLAADISDDELDGLISQLQRDQASAEADIVLEELLPPELLYQAAAMGSGQLDRTALNYELLAEVERLWDLRRPCAACGNPTADGGLLANAEDAPVARQLGAVYSAECVMLVHKLAAVTEVLWATVVEQQPTEADVVRMPITWQP
jgi:hypothetical protein